MPKADIYQEITDQIIDIIEQGCPPWLKPWTGNTGAGCFPLRSTGETYKGINVLMLWIAAVEQEFNSAHWFTYNQANEKGGQVQKGQKSTRVVYYNTIKGEDEKGEEFTIPFLKTYRVFNSDQIEGLPEQFYTPPDPVQNLGTKPEPRLDSIFSDFGIQTITSEKPEAFYLPASDYIHMPPIETFKSADRYYTTLAHEHIHATGAKHRLNRDFSAIKPEFAFEELIAEIGACMLCARIGLTPDLEQSGAYVEGWLECLKNDKKAIFKAASQAQKAVDYLLALSQGGQEDE